MGKYVELQIKCPRCGSLNHFKAQSLPPERHGASTDKDAPDDRQQKTQGPAGAG